MEAYYHDLNKKNADYYGFVAQSDQCIEENAELIQAIRKWCRCSEGLGQPTRMTIKEAYDNLVEEIADVEVMLEQMKYLRGITQEEVDKVKVEKILRTRDCIEKEN